MTIYFIRAGDSGNIKIGYTAGCPKKRMAQLQTGNIFDLELLGTIPGEMQDEKSMHHELSDYALRGEWFKPTNRLLSVIYDMIEHQHPWYFIRNVSKKRVKQDPVKAGARKPWYLHRIQEETEKLREAQIQAIKAEIEAGIIYPEIPEETLSDHPHPEAKPRPWYLKEITDITNKRRAFQNRYSDAISIIDAKKAHQSKISVAA